MQSYTEIPDTKTITESRSLLLDNDKSVMSCFSGAAFPTANLQVGMLCLRTDQGILYQLKDATPTWKLIADLNKVPIWSDGGTFSSNLTAEDLISRGSAADGGRVALGYKDNTSMAGANSRWFVDVDAANALRIFRTNAAGTTVIAFSINEATGSVTLVSGLNLGGTLAMGGSQITGAELRNYREEMVTANAGTAYACDGNLANVFDLTLTGSPCALTFTNVPAGQVFSLTLRLKQDATGSRTVTWPAAVKWPSGVAPVLTVTANKTDYVSLTTYDGGATWDGFPGARNI